MFLASVRATPEERKRSLPADLLITDAAATVMHAVTIAAPPKCIWPWLLKMGSGRAGWYSYDWVDNDGHPSATQIISALQHVAPGDVMPSLPGAKESFIVVAVQPERDLILTVPAAGGGLLVSWEFFLEPLAQRRTACSCADGSARNGWGVERKTGGLSAPHRTRVFVARETSALADGARRILRPRYYADAAASGDQASCGRDQPLGGPYGFRHVHYRPKGPGCRSTSARLRNRAAGRPETQK